jgi:putative intracellular protease/amidase
MTNLVTQERRRDSGSKNSRRPFWVFKDARAEITLASVKGGQPPLDPKSDEPDAQTESTKRFRTDSDAQALLAHTHSLSEVNEAEYDAVFYHGGHGPLWDLAEDAKSISLIAAFHTAGKPVAFVCHAPGVLRYVAIGPVVGLVAMLFVSKRIAQVQFSAHGRM